MSCQSSSLEKRSTQLGIAVPGVREELVELPPRHLADWWQWEFCSFHSPAWWRRHWEKTGLVEVTTAHWLDDGHALWRAWEQMTAQWSATAGGKAFDRDRGMLEADTDELLGFTLLTAGRPAAAASN